MPVSWPSGRALPMVVMRTDPEAAMRRTRPVTRPARPTAAPVAARPLRPVWQALAELIPIPSPQAPATPRLDVRLRPPT